MEREYTYTYNPAKNELNKVRHGWDLEKAREAFEGGATFVSRYQERKGEDRWTGFGKIDQKTVFVVYREFEEEKRRHIISLRAATAKERREYEIEAAREIGIRNQFILLLEDFGTKKPQDGGSKQTDAES